ncbi:MAG: Uma2 family endonuclease [Cyanobacteria bacterium P01_F01_bin.150]
MVAQTQEKWCTVNEYLEIELTSEERHEYRNGAIIPMPGRTPTHNFISGNLYIALSLALKRKPYATLLFPSIVLANNIQSTHHPMIKLLCPSPLFHVLNS